MLSSDEIFKVGHILDDLRQFVGESEFGYRAQGLLAHVLLRIGCKIVNINPQGHPDIIAKLGSQTLLIQAKSIHGKVRRKGFILESDDLEGIHPKNDNTIGYLAVLDCMLPISWIFVNYTRLIRQVLQPTHIVSLFSMRDKNLSIECTEEFIKLVIKHQDHLRNLYFHILSNRALRGKPL